MKYLSTITIVLVILIFGIVFYAVILKAPTQMLYCRKEVELRLYIFRQALKKNGADLSLEENEDIKKFFTQMYIKCLKKERVQ
ncbi:hypothetical protein HYW87_01195 [Candidatus Roizmanbacteria bacterium]|nr:hypothetical protein [Candidatus Roizmanbacteria bacterium]